MDLERTFSRKIIFVPGLACFVFLGLAIAVGVFKMAYHILRILRSMPLPIFLNHITNISLYLLPIEECSKASSFLLHLSVVMKSLSSVENGVIVVSRQKV